MVWKESNMILCLTTVHPLLYVHAGNLRCLSLKVSRVTSNFAFLLWNNVKFPDQRNLLSYIIVYKEA
jgi:hypothetical protein